MAAFCSCLRLQREVALKAPKAMTPIMLVGSGTEVVLVNFTSSSSSPILSPPNPSKANLAVVAEVTVMLRVKVVKLAVDGSVIVSLNRLPNDTSTELRPLFL